MELDFLILLLRNEEFEFYYKNKKYEIVHGYEKKTSLYLSDGSRTGQFIQSFNSHSDFLNNAIIDGKNIRDILNEITLP